MPCSYKNWVLIYKQNQKHTVKKSVQCDSLLGETGRMRWVRVKRGLPVKEHRCRSQPLPVIQHHFTQSRSEVQVTNLWATLTCNCFLKQITWGGGHQGSPSTHRKAHNSSSCVFIFSLNTTDKRTAHLTPFTWNSNAWCKIDRNLSCPPVLSLQGTLPLKCLSAL